MYSNSDLRLSGFLPEHKAGLHESIFAISAREDLSGPDLSGQAHAEAKVCAMI